MQKRILSLEGCYELLPDLLDDTRGVFVKTFNANTFVNYGLSININESYFTHSHRGVIRGLHFQVPPKDHVKLVFCIAG